MSTAPRPPLQLSVKCLGPVAKLDATLSKNAQNLVYARNGTGKSFLTRALRYLDLHAQGSDISDAAFNLVSEEAQDSQGRFSLSQGDVALASLSLNQRANKVSADTHDRIFHVFSDEFVHSELRQQNYEMDGNIENEICLDQTNIDTKEVGDRLEATQKEFSKARLLIQNSAETEKIQELSNKCGINKSLREYMDINVENLVLRRVQPTLPQRLVKDILGDLDALKAISAEPDYPSEIKTFSPDPQWISRTKHLLGKITSPSTISEEIKNYISCHPDFVEAGLDVLEKSGDESCPFCRQSIAHPPAKDAIELYMSYFADAEGKHKKELRSAWTETKANRTALNACLTAAAREVIKFEALKKFVPSQKIVQLPNLSQTVQLLDNAFDHINSLVEKKGRAPGSAVAIPEFDFYQLVANVNAIVSELNSAFGGITAAIKASDAERKALHREACNAFDIEFTHRNWALINVIHELEVDVRSISEELATLKRSQLSANVKERVADTFEALMRGFFGAKYTFDRADFVLNREQKKMVRGASRTLSDGEKTAIAFCYFIACAHKKVNSSSDYARLFFVFDDPITSMSYDFIFAIAQTLKNISINTSGEISINPSSIATASRPDLLVFTHSTYFYNICVTNNVVKDDAAFFLHQAGAEHKLSKRTRYVAPFEQYLKQLVDVHGGQEPDHTTGNAVRCVIEAVGRFCHPDKCDSLSNFITYLAGEGGFEIRSVLINNLSHGTYYDESPSPDELREACGEAISIVEKYARGQLEMVRVLSLPPASKQIRAA